MKLYVAAVINKRLGDDIESLILLDIWPTRGEAALSAQEWIDKGLEDYRCDYKIKVIELPAYNCWEALCDAENKYLSGN